MFVFAVPNQRSSLLFLDRSVVKFRTFLHDRSGISVILLDSEVWNLSPYPTSVNLVDIGCYQAEEILFKCEITKQDIRLLLCIVLFLHLAVSGVVSLSLSAAALLLLGPFVSSTPSSPLGLSVRQCPTRCRESASTRSHMHFPSLVDCCLTNRIAR